MIKHKGVFIAGTGTSVGKTLVCGCLARFLKMRGVRIGVQKWVSTGNKEISNDMAFCSSMLSEPLQSLHPMSLISPYTFAYPASPHLAAELEGTTINEDRIIQSYRDLSKHYELLLVEGTGGVMVPLTRDSLFIDIVARLKLPTLIVSLSGLGTINHTLLTIEALRTRDIPILGVVFNLTGREDPIIENDNSIVISQIGRVKNFGLLPQKNTREELIEAFEPIGERILDAVKNL
ncbi:MAG: dethiobiotin synthase [Pseudomonadota bacterium]